MQTSPETHRRLYKIKAALHHWLIKIGLDLPPDETNNLEKHLSEEQDQARRELRFHQLPRPPRGSWR